MDSEHPKQPMQWIKSNSVLTQEERKPCFLEATNIHPKRQQHVKKDFSKAKKGWKAIYTDLGKQRSSQTASPAKQPPYAITKIPNRTNCKTNTWTAERKHLRMKNSNKTNSKEDCKQCKESHSRKKAASKAGDMEPWTCGKKSRPTEKKQYILSRTKLTSQHKGNE